MERELPGLLTPETEQSWQVLCELLDFAADFTLVALLADDPFPARVLRDRLTRRAEARDWPLRACVVAADTSPDDAWMQLLDRDAADPAAVVWFEATALKAHDASWWRTFALRLNERRELLRRGAMRVLILVMPAAVKATFREAASDLWSILQEALPVAATPPVHGGATVHAPTVSSSRLRRAIASGDDGDLRARAEASTAAPADRAAANAALAERAAEHQDWTEATLRWAKAAELYRDLATARPAVYQGELAACLDRLSLALSEQGRWADALPPATEAVTVYRMIAEERPAVFSAKLAGSLSRLAMVLSKLGRNDEAITAARESVGIARGLARTDEAFAPDLAMALHNLGNALGAAGQHAEALSATAEAVNIKRKLATSQPKSGHLDLAMSLSNLSARLNRVGRREEALQSAQESVDTYRELVRLAPGTYEAGLSSSLTNLAIARADLGPRSEAVAAAQEATEIHRGLARSRPAVFLPELAKSLANLALILAKLDRPEEGLKATAEAMKIVRDLFKAKPSQAVGSFAATLRAHVAVLIASGRRQEAATQARRGLGRLWPHFEQHPPALAPVIADLLKSCLLVYPGPSKPNWLVRYIDAYDSLCRAAEGCASR